MFDSKTFRNTWPWALFALQAVCVFYLLADPVTESLGVGHVFGHMESDTLEYLIIGALVIGLVASGVEIRKTLTRQRRLENQIKAASGAFSLMLEEHFQAWGLTPSETDVALLALKGFSIAEIAAVRKTAEGTVKAQCNAIYRKAGVSGRPQLLSLFIDELLQGALLPSDDADRAGEPVKAS